MILKKLVLGVVVLGVVSAVARADDPKPASAKTDIEKFKGKWTGKVGPNQDIPITVEFREKEVVVSVDAGDGNQVNITGEFKLDEKASPKRIDFVKFQSPEGEAMPDNLGIYELKEDELKVCTGGPGMERPTEFVAMQDGGHGTIVLTRLKEKKVD